MACPGDQPSTGSRLSSLVTGGLGKSALLNPLDSASPRFLPVHVGAATGYAGPGAGAQRQAIALAEPQPDRDRNPPALLRRDACTTLRSAPLARALLSRDRGPPAQVARLGNDPPGARVGPRRTAAQVRKRAGVARAPGHRRAPTR